MIGIVSEERVGATASINPLSLITHTNGIKAGPAARVSAAAASASPLRTIQIIERWEFARGCLAFWLQQACPDYEIMAAPSFDHLLDDEFDAGVAAVVVGRETLHLADDWLEEELTRVRRGNRDVPVVAILSTDLLERTESLIQRLGLRGYILTSDSTEVASAALRLVIAGGTHFPRVPNLDPAGKKRTPENPPASNPLLVHLTQKERAVVDSLGRGNPNKVIAHELNMSLSTVKAHVHRIIRKLNVNNRTAVAVFAQSLRNTVGPLSEL